MLIISPSNEYLKERGMAIADLFTDLRDGIMLVNVTIHRLDSVSPNSYAYLQLLEVISSKKLGRYNRNPRIPAQRLENCVIALNFIKEEGLKLVNIGPEDIVDCKPKLILGTHFCRSYLIKQTNHGSFKGLIWTLILRYQIKMIAGEDTSAKNALLEWVRSKIPEYDVKGFTKGASYQLSFMSFLRIHFYHLHAYLIGIISHLLFFVFATTDWNDGRAICALVSKCHIFFLLKCVLFLRTFFCSIYTQQYCYLTTTRTFSKEALTLVATQNFALSRRNCACVCVLVYG